MFWFISAFKSLHIFLDDHLLLAFIFLTKFIIVTGHSGHTSLQFPSSPALCCFHLNTLPNWIFLIKSFFPFLSFARENYITLPDGADLWFQFQLGPQNCLAIPSPVHSNDSWFDGPDLYDGRSRLYPSVSHTYFWCFRWVLHMQPFANL